MINVVIVDDQKIVRQGIKMILSLDDEITILNEVENGNQLLELLNNGQHPDVILMDIRMPIIDGVEATRLVKEKYKKIKIIILTTFNEDEYILEGIKNGADGYILKDAGSDYIIKAIKTAYNGNMLLDPKVTTKLVKAYNSIFTEKHEPNNYSENKKKLDMLTQRELDVAKLVGQGKSNKDICNILFLREGTVKINLIYTFMMYYN